MIFDAFFSTTIANAKFEKHSDIQSDLVEHCHAVKTTVKSGGEGWISNKTYNTSNGRYDLLKDSKFLPLNNWVMDMVNQYCINLGIDHSLLTSTGSWFNIYQKYDYQEKHVHPNSIISCIYILAASEQSAKVYFTTPLNDMFHVKYTGTQQQQTTQQICCESIPGTLIIFPSYLPHSVERHDTDDLRISLSYNFKQIN